MVLIGYPVGYGFHPAYFLIKAFLALVLVVITGWAVHDMYDTVVQWKR
jgi:hypothetical protein